MRIRACLKARLSAVEKDKVTGQRERKECEGEIERRLKGEKEDEIEGKKNRLESNSKQRLESQRKRGNNGAR